MQNPKTKEHLVVKNAAYEEGKELYHLSAQETPYLEISCDMGLSVFPREEKVKKSNALLELMHTIDIWGEIKKHLKPREFQTFELRYRYMYKISDIMRIFGSKSTADVGKSLMRAKKRLRATFLIKEK